MFMEYMRNALRMSAMMKIGTIYVIVMIRLVGRRWPNPSSGRAISDDASNP
jgi:hypothetical protein